MGYSWDGDLTVKLETENLTAFFTLESKEKLVSIGQELLAIFSLCVVLIPVH